MQQKINVIIVFLLVVPFTLLIVSYSSYWWRFEEKQLGETYYFKFDQIKNVTKSGHSTTSKWNDKTNHYTNQLYEASLALAAVGWVFTILNIIMAALCIYKKNIKNSKLWTNITKVLPMAVTFFCFLSTIIFVAIPTSLKRDCQENNAVDPDYSGDIDSICEEEQHYHFFGSNNKHSWGPVQGWVCVCISTAVSFIVAILSMLYSTFTEKESIESRYLLL